MPERSGYVYVMSMSWEDTVLCKIGRTKKAPETRLDYRLTNCREFFDVHPFCAIEVVLRNFAELFQFSTTVSVGGDMDSELNDIRNKYHRPGPPPWLIPEFHGSGEGI